MTFLAPGAGQSEGRSIKGSSQATTLPWPDVEQRYPISFTPSSGDWKCFPSVKANGFIRIGKSTGSDVSGSVNKTFNYKGVEFYGDKSMLVTTSESQDIFGLDTQ